MMTNQRNPEGRINFQLLVPNIAHYIRSLRLDKRYQHDQRLMAEIAKAVLGDPRRGRDIEASLRSYDTGPGSCKFQYYYTNSKNRLTSQVIRNYVNYKIQMIR